LTSATNDARASLGRPAKSRTRKPLAAIWRVCDSSDVDLVGHACDLDEYLIEVDTSPQMDRHLRLEVRLTLLHP
jgi:hypothetical protein